MRITAGTRVFALLGDPVAHSLSPAMHNAGFHAAGLDAIYIALRCSSTALPGLLAGIARAGGGGNITVPHKHVAAATVNRRTEAVARTGACNTFWFDEGEICGDNTDVAGFAAAANALLGSCAGIRALIIGAGGAARAAVVALTEARADRVDLLNRSPARLEALQKDLATVAPGLHVLSAADLAAQDFDLVINATPLGLRSADPAPLDLNRIRRAGAVLDLVYRPDGTAWTHHARAMGIPAADGTAMLLAQGGAAFERWWNQPAPLPAMSAALEMARGG